MNPGHQPERFQEFTLLPNQRSFTIKDSTHVFQLDRYGGWFDQYGNYYNNNCEADDPPSSSESYSHQDERQSFSSEEDVYQKEFGKPPQGADYQEEEEIQNLAAIAQNRQILAQYPKETHMRVYFENLGRDCKKNQVLNAYRQICKGILSVNFKKNSRQGYFIVADYQNGILLIEQQGKKVLDRPLYFEVEKYEQNLLNSITQEELTVKEEVQVKRYVLKEKVQGKVQEAPKATTFAWKWYKFEKSLFPKRTGFKTWMQENGFIFEQDFKNIQKIDNDTEKKYAKIEMKESAFNSLIGLEFQGKKVEFLPL